MVQWEPQQKHIQISNSALIQFNGRLIGIGQSVVGLRQGHVLRHRQCCHCCYCRYTAVWSNPIASNRNVWIWNLRRKKKKQIALNSVRKIERLTSRTTQLSLSEFEFCICGKPNWQKASAPQTIASIQLAKHANSLKNVSHLNNSELLMGSRECWIGLFQCDLARIFISLNLADEKTYFKRKNEMPN